MAATGPALAVERTTNNLSVRRGARQGAHVQEMQRRRILLAICEIVGEHGLQEASIGAVCKRAGVSRRTFYEIFVDREACLLAALQDVLRRLAGVIVPLYRSNASWSDRVGDVVAQLLASFDEEPGIARMCVVETLRASPRVQDARSTVVALLADAIDEGRGVARRGSVPPPPLTAQGVIGGALSVVHARLLENPHAPLSQLAGQLTAMIVHPYLGPAAAERELTRRPASSKTAITPAHAQDIFKDLPIRFTYRTARVLAVIAATPGASNRDIANSAGISDEGQASRLLRRLADAELITNNGTGWPAGGANAWTLTNRGKAIHTAITPHQTPTN